jgi:hypothetical protein
MGVAAAFWATTLSALEIPKCTDSRGHAVKFYEEPSESGMRNAHADYRRECDAAGRCQSNPIVVYNPKHPYLQNPVMAAFTLLHECGHHAHGDALVKRSPEEPIDSVIRRESKADCYAARRAKDERLLSCDDLQSVSETLANAGRVTEERRAALLKQCVRRIGCR